MAETNSFNPSDLAEAISQAEDEHGTNLFRAMNTSAFSRLPITDQVEVVKSFADRLPSRSSQKAQEGPSFSETSSKALSGLRRGAQTGALVGSAGHVASFFSRGLDADEKAYENQEFLSRRLPVSIGVGALAGGISGAYGSYKDAQKRQENARSQAQKLRAIQLEDDDRKRNMLALSMLSSVPHLVSGYDSPRPKDPIEEWVSTPSSKVTQFVPPKTAKPDPDAVLKFKADASDKLVANHFRSKT